MNNKKTTTDDVLSRFKKMLDEFQLERENYYTEEWGLSVKNSKQSITKEELTSISEEIAQRIHQDTTIFVKNYTNDMTDQVLDAINNKQLSKDKGHLFLTMLLGMKQAFAN